MTCWRDRAIIVQPQQGVNYHGKGTFGNAGQNLYVSRRGVLQRIYQYDFNKDGYFDLVFCNDHDHGESTPTYVYRDPLGAADRLDVASDGAVAGVMVDLNGDGYDDLVLGMFTNGSEPDLNSFVYYGSTDGFGERRRQLLPVPNCTSVAAGDFNGDGRIDLAFLRYDAVSARTDDDPDDFSNRLRIFTQTELGFEPTERREISVDVDHCGCNFRDVLTGWDSVREDRLACSELFRVGSRV